MLMLMTTMMMMMMIMLMLMMTTMMLMMWWWWWWWCWCWWRRWWWWCWWWRWWWWWWWFIFIFIIYDDDDDNDEDEDDGDDDVVVVVVCLFVCLFVRELLDKEASPFLLRLHGWLMPAPGVMHIVMETADTDLLTALKRDMSLKRRLNIAWEVGLGLKCIHDAGYIHEDLKPQNILVRLHLLPKNQKTLWPDVSLLFS